MANDDRKDESETSEEESDGDESEVQESDDEVNPEDSEQESESGSSIEEVRVTSVQEVQEDDHARGKSSELVEGRMEKGRDGEERIGEVMEVEGAEGIHEDYLGSDEEVEEAEKEATEIPISAIDAEEPK